MGTLHRAGVVAALVILALPLASAQAGVRLFPGETEAATRPGLPAELTWIAVSELDDEGRLLVLDAHVNGEGWSVDVSPAFETLPARGSLPLTVTATPSARAASEVTVTLVVTTTDRQNQTHVLTATGTVAAEGAGAILGRFDNPLPPPLDDAGGAFLLNVAAWLVIGLFVMWLVNPALRLVTYRTKTTVDDRVIQIVSRPVFVLVFTYGLKQSLEVLPLPAWLYRTVDAVWVLVLVSVLVYMAFRLWHEIVLALGRRVASRTESKLDDRLLPVLEKLGGVVIVLVGLFYIFDSLGVNMTWLAAGGALVSLVIAFAAQDTLSNFFGGVHLLVDRPFTEGDDIILETGEVCTVKKIGLRSTDLYHIANHEIIILPNNQLATKRVINVLQPDNLYKVNVRVGVAYGTDVQKVKRLLLDLARSHPLSLDEQGHEPFVRFHDFGQSSLDFSVTCWIGDVYARWAVASDLREMIEQRFAEEGIEIPFPQRVVWQGRDEKERAARDGPRPPAGPGEGPVPHESTAAARANVAPDAEGEP